MKQETYSKIFYKDHSEKAIKAAIAVEDYNNQVKIKTFYAPKSLLKDGALPDWFITKKFEEIRNRDWTLVRYSVKSAEEYPEADQFLALACAQEFAAALE